MRAWAGGLLAMALGLAVALTAVAPGHTPTGDRPTAPSTSRQLQGRVVVLDPGHQLGNRGFPSEVNRPVPAGGFTKPCNTTGTATDDGYPEATFTFDVSRIVRARLLALGIRVVLTRDTNRTDLWGPCVDERGRAGNRQRADLKLSLHADGNVGGGPGFHVITPRPLAGWTADIACPSRRFALGVRAELRGRGLPYAAYTAGGDGLDVRGDLGTLNLSDVPAVIVELGNMRDPADARRMTSRAGQEAYAAALVAAVRAYLVSAAPSAARRPSGRPRR